jgi:hypothetical protein
MRPCSCICHQGKLFHGHGEFCCINAVHIPKKQPGPGEHEPYVEVVRGQGNRGTCACGWRTEPMGKDDAQLAVEHHKVKTQPKTESVWERAQERP